MPLLPKPLIFSSVKTLKISIFPEENQCFSGFHQKHVFAIFMHFSFQKPFQNEARTLSKSMSKTGCFSTSIFSRLGLNFGASWASNLEPSWPQNPFFRLLGAFFCLLKLDVFKNGVLEDPRLDFGGFQARFWRPRGSILDSLGSIFSKFLHCFFQVSPPRIPPAIYNAKNAKMLKRLRRQTIFRVQTPRVRPRRSVLLQWLGPKRVGGGGPPQGVTIKSAAHRRWCRAC